MIQKYAYSHNGIMHWVKGMLPILGRDTTVSKTATSNKIFVWRNQALDAYKISHTFEDKPLDLTHFLIVRTRENLMI
jgi:hypothetical protein